MHEDAACPLCQSDRIRFFALSGPRRYLDCEVCRLVHLAAGERLPADAERRHYELHENDPADEAYRAFLERIAEPLRDRLPSGASGLDYGAGPGPALAPMLRERGFRMTIYDPIFAPDRAALRGTYDFITCTEAAEHFYSPRGEFDRMNLMLRPGGHLGVMTSLLRHECVFENWYYARDPTHVSFYRPATMHWIAARYGWTAVFPHPNVVLFQKPVAGRLRTQR